MKKYIVTVISRIEVEIEAETKIAAIAIAKEKHPDHKADEVYDGETQESVDSCGGCGVDILESETGGNDNDGDAFCKGCWEAMQEDYRPWRAEFEALLSAKGLTVVDDNWEVVNHAYSLGKTPEEALTVLIEDLSNAEGE